MFLDTTCLCRALTRANDQDMMIELNAKTVTPSKLSQLLTQESRPLIGTQVAAVTRMFKPLNIP